VRNAPANQDVSGSIEKLLVLAFDLALFQRVLSHVDLTQLKLTIKRVHVLVTFSIKRPDIDDPGSLVTTSRAPNDGEGFTTPKPYPLVYLLKEGLACGKTKPILFWKRAAHP
jgi:hypothetical protein